MERIKIRSRLLMVIVLLLFPAWCPAAEKSNSCEEWIAKVVSIEGSVEVRRVDNSQWRPVQLNDTFSANDIIRVQEFSRAALVLCNESVLRLDQNTTLTLTGVEEKKTTLLDLIGGTVHFFSRISRSLKFFCPFVNGAVEGTEFVVMVDERQAEITLFQGRVMASNDQGRIDMVSGQTAVAGLGRPPVLKTVVRPRDAVQWALYYPLIADPELDSSAPGADPKWAETTQQAARRYHDGDTPGALVLLMQIPPEIKDPRFFAQRAGLLLSVGRVEAARADIGRSLALSPSNAYALALESMVALVLNQKDDALRQAGQAVAADPGSIPAKISLSYAQQAHFDLKSALATMEDAVGTDPQSALAWARLAELRQMVGDLDAALEAARRAAGLRPDLALVQTVLGFSHLTRIELNEAQEAFEKAIRLDQGNPLPRLGLGLATIRRGHLAAGRGEIEIAASLDPDNSLIRSYLGKAYYEEKRDSLAEEQLAAAKRLDPKDPTPWFYDAIRKQTINRPVEALRDLQKSIELNDNRAVYRSRLLLDEDLAARSASLGRIYSDLGFQQLALVEGWNSVNTDPANFSAHRFLADSYAALPRHEITRVSELLQSQLLQPININPVGPNLAESNLSIFQGTGPSSPSFKEFNPLFNRNRMALQLSGVAGENRTLGDETVLSGVWDKVSFSIGQFHQQADGFRDNNDLNENIYNAFAQVSLTPKASVQAEVRSKKISNGDLGLLFDPEQYNPNRRNRLNVDSYRLGGHYVFTPGSEVIASFIGQNARDDFKDSIPDFVSINDKQKEKGHSIEFQHLFKKSRFNLISGAGYVTGKIEQKLSVQFDMPFISDRYEVNKGDIRHTNAYVYSQFDVLDNLTVTGGMSYDDFDNDRVDQSQFNPKLGATWRPFAKTTLRAAVFRVLTRTLLNDQTVEPTQVAGFNQFYRDAPGTDIWSYGAAVDQQLLANLFCGAEYTQRDLTIPYRLTLPPPAPPQLLDTDWDEQTARAYLYWTPHPWFAGSAEYLYERWDRGDDLGGEEEVRKLSTHRLGLGGGFFHPSGFFARIKATYIDQDGEFWNPGMVSTRDDSDRAWVADAAIGYRFPKRYGMLTLEVKNLFDTEFKFQDTDAANPSIYPGTTGIGTLCFKLLVWGKKIQRQ